MEKSLNVAVIGAGMAGLVTARELQREGHRVVVFEKSTKIGGTWVYDPRVETDLLGLDPSREIVHSSMYHCLRTNIPRQLMGFTDYPFTKKEEGDPRNFPDHEEVLRFLNDFARDFELVDMIRFGQEVIRVEQDNRESNGWVVEWRSRVKGSDWESKEEVFEAVVVCNGKFTEPRIAEFPGMDEWRGLQIHSHNYRTAEPFQNKMVVLIGNGPSAWDISNDISAVAIEVHVASRAPDVLIGKLDNQNTIWRHSMIERVCEDGKVVFQDGSSVYADALIHCTGYKLHFPFLRTNGIVSVDDNRVGPLYKHVFSPILAPTLSFVGLTSLGATLVIELQAKWVARVLSGKILLPTEEEMNLSVQEFYQRIEETAGWPKHHTHDLRHDKFRYQKWLAAELGLPPLEQEEPIIFSFLKAISPYGAQYRDIWDVDKWMRELKSSNK